jgi:RimJ/RimL family protein N-acetyltransferase
MLLPATDADFALLLEGRAPRGLRLPDSALAPPEVLAMLRDLAAVIATVFEPAAWLVVDGDEAVGLLSVTRPPHEGELHIGYGVAPSREGRGIATRAVGELVDWARGDARVIRLTADTSVDNLGSQRVLESNGFTRIGEREDPEDGRLACWERRLRG